MSKEEILNANDDALHVAARAKTHLLQVGDLHSLPLELLLLRALLLEFGPARAETLQFRS